VEDTHEGLDYERDGGGRCGELGCLDYGLQFGSRIPESGGTTKTGSPTGTGEDWSGETGGAGKVN
jgi:hypothetical protein